MLRLTIKRLAKPNFMDTFPSFETPFTPFSTTVNGNAMITGPLQNAQNNNNTTPMIATQPALNYNTGTSLTPNFNMGAPNFNILPQQPTIIIDESNFKTKFKHPKLVEQMKLSSDSCLRSYNGLYYNFILPCSGDYANNFCLQSNYILKGIKDGQMVVDCLSNYIENVTLTINNSSFVFSRLENFSHVDLLNPQHFKTNDKLVLKLDFLNLPLLTKCLDDSNYQIAIKFTQPPPIKFDLLYDMLLTGDHLYHQSLKNEEFCVTYQISGTQRKRMALSFRKGKLSLKSC